ncbi:MAG: fumarylacetoacetate hydrolase family protein [Phycisphaerales bacterium]|nr:fumarylacetoacetate hydrolase family protein [Phycisphaerales bacterium]
MTPPPAILCIGRNYEAHAAEMGASAPDAPTVFMKNPASVIANGEPIVIPGICNAQGPEVDYEGELAVILDQDLRNATPETAMAAVGGYAVANDVSARWWQKKGSGGQWIRGKSFDTFCPMSTPVPAASIPDPQSLQLVTRLNGDVMQEASTADMIFGVQDLLVDLSRDMTLLAGTVLLTGTPAGVGAGRTPPRFLQDGDVVEIEIERVGSLSNPVTG